MPDHAVCAVGNPHTLGQPPLTFNRQVLALCAAPFLMDHPSVLDLFPEDAVARARQMVGYLSGGVGAYSDTCGAMGIREEVAEFIAARDGCAPHASHARITTQRNPSVRQTT